MWHGAWGGEGHVDARLRLRRRTAFNRIGGWFTLCWGLFDLLLIFMRLVFSFAWDGCLVL